MRVDSEIIAVYAKKLRMPTLLALESTLRDAKAGNCRYEQFLLALLKAEVERREINQRQQRIKEAKFPQIKTLDEFDFGWPKHIQKATICELATGRFIEEKKPIVAFGNPGTGNGESYRLKEHEELIPTCPLDEPEGISQPMGIRRWISSRLKNAYI